MNLATKYINVFMRILGLTCKFIAVCFITAVVKAVVVKEQDESLTNNRF